MSIFRETVIKALNDYKGICHKFDDPNNRSAKLDDLSIRRRDLRTDTDISLFNKAKLIMQDIETKVRQNANSSSWYSGLDEFHHHLKKTLSEYQIQGNSIIHCSQAASRALVEAVQAIAMCASNLSEKVANKLDDSSAKIAYYGNSEQQKKYMKMLQTYKQTNPNFFLVRISHFQELLEEANA